MLSLYEVLEVEGSGVGCFAVRDLEPGSIIIEEKPILRVLGRSNDILPAFQSLTSHAQIQCLLLHASSDERDSQYSNDQTSPDPSILEQIQSRIFELELLIMDEETFLTAYMSNPDGVDATLDRMNEARRGITNKIKEIYYTNCFGTSATDQGQRHPSGGILNNDISRINNSCVPNAQFIFDTVTETFRAYAIKKIPVGHEIFVSYLDA